MYHAWNVCGGALRQSGKNSETTTINNYWLLLSILYVFLRLFFLFFRYVESINLHSSF